jgi:hypothetical protein
MNRRLEVSELDELAGKALERAEAALRDDDPATAKLWLDHLICLRALERTREVEILARMELGVLDGGGP